MVGTSSKSFHIGLHQATYPNMTPLIIGQLNFLRKLTPSKGGLAWEEVTPRKRKPSMSPSVNVKPLLPALSSAYKPGVATKL